MTMKRGKTANVWRSTRIQQFNKYLMCLWASDR